MNILLAEPSGFSALALEHLRKHATIESTGLDRQSLLSKIRDADVLWVRLRHKIDSEIMTAAPRLKVIVSPTTGLNHIDLDEAGRRRIQVLSLRGDTEFLKEVHATAEHTIGLILGLLRHIPSAHAHVQSGGWDRDCFRGRELHGKTVGVVGYGRLGRAVAKYLQAFGARILTADPAARLHLVGSGVALVAIDKLLKQSDIVTLHVNLSRETKGFFNQQKFETMKEGAWFINTARGELIDESALLDALISGRLAGAALDVLCDEYGIGLRHGSKLVKYANTHSNLIITPHLGGCTLESMEKTELHLARRLISFLENLE
jgi:D-3-phosphoglycerate dehydrogenase